MNASPRMLPPKLCAILMIVLACCVWSPSSAQKLNASPPLTSNESSQDAAAVEALQSIEHMVTKRIAAMDEANALQLQALEGRADLLARQTELRKDMLTNAQKSVDWWLAMLAISLTTVGVVIPLLLLRQLKDKHARDIADARAALNQIEGHHKSAQQDLADLKNITAQALPAPTSTGG
jgi:uncharacterized membrane protein YccC